MQHMSLYIVIILCVLNSLLEPRKQCICIAQETRLQQMSFWNTSISEEQIRIFHEVNCPTLYGNGEVPIVIIYTEFNGHHQNEEMNRIYLVHLILWDNGRIIWNAGNLDEVKYQEKQLTKEVLNRTIESLVKTIPWDQKLETDLALEGIHTTIVATFGNKRFLYMSDLEEKQKELAWSHATGWKLYTRQIPTNKPDLQLYKESTDNAWYPPRPVDAKSLIKSIIECVPLDNSKQIDVLFFPSNDSNRMRDMWKNGIEQHEALDGKWRRGMKIRAGKPWW